MASVTSDKAVIGADDKLGNDGMATKKQRCGLLLSGVDEDGVGVGVGVGGATRRAGATTEGCRWC
ncbi:hypothetical protein AGMMS49950_04220 [Endomicrobiia bacterium]|nr:hypothetical protein AGMMS49950_04220 [Endomicrobiia bacterium]